MQTASDITDPNQLPARLPKGFEIGGCVVDGWLRDGGMAAIYRGRRASDGRKVAIKLQLPSTAGDPKICAHFDLEGEAMRRVAKVPQVVEILDSGVLEDGRRYFVLEWVEGEDLEELIDVLRNRDRRLSVARACRIGEQIALGLAAMHEHDLVHRDLKPANVMVAGQDAHEDVVKLVDFGIVADLRDGHDDEPASNDGTVLGTSAYMPPEQLHGAPPTAGFDVFSLGVVLFEALSGNCVPPDGWTPESLPRVETLRRGIPDELSELVHGCIRSDPTERPTSAAALAEQLAEIAVALEQEQETAEAADSLVSQPIPIRTGGTELVPHADIVEHALAHAPGGTEVSLTHQEVLTSTGARAPLFVPLPPAAEEPAEAPSSDGGGRRRWLVIGAAVTLLIGVGWAMRGPSEDGAAEGSAMADRSKPGSGDTVNEHGTAASDESSAAVADAGLPSPPVAATDDESSASDGGPAGDPAAAVPTVADAEPPEEPEPDAREASKPSRPKGPSKEECEAMRNEAATSKKGRQWKAVLEATRKRACWSGSSRLERKRLRVEAFAELGEFSRCVKEGGGSSDREISARVKYCKKKVE